MKLNQAAKQFETNADFTSQDFTIGDVSVVIEILRNKLYRHKVRTLVQEYISNGRDAMREVKAKGKIDIILPTTFEPTFKVRDYGPGISPDRMYNVFIKYASSTKRKNNLQTGGFGIGAKSAWSYTESFTIVTYIDGIQRTYVAHIGANNNGRLDYLGETKTKEPNGTEIQIPVSPKDNAPARKSKDTVKIERTKQQFVLHDLGRWRRQAQNTSIADNDKKWLWIDHASDYDKTMHQELANYLQDHGWNICALGQDAQRRVKGDRNFKPLAEWLANFKPTKAHIATLKNEKATQQNMISELKKLKGYTDKIIKAMVEEYATLQGGTIPDMLKAAIGDLDEVKEFVKAEKEFVQHINKTYPLLNHIEWDSKINDELVSYMNSK